jgi:hypothetical protein
MQEQETPVFTQEQRQQLIRESNKLKKDIEIYYSREEAQEKALKHAESRVDALEEEKFGMLEQISSLKCDLSLKETELVRSYAKLAEYKEHYQKLEEKYKSQKERIQQTAQQDKSFYKGLQEVVDYYTESLVRYSRFSNKMLFKLIVNEPLQVEELSEEFSQRASCLSILKGSHDKEEGKTAKKALYTHLKKKIDFSSELELEKTQKGFDKLQQELKFQGVRVEVNDMTFLMDNQTYGKIKKNNGGINSSQIDEISLLNESISDTSMNNQTMFLSDLDQESPEKSKHFYTDKEEIQVSSLGGVNDMLETAKKYLQTQFSSQEAPDFNKVLQIWENVEELLGLIAEKVNVEQVKQPIQVVRSNLKDIHVR